jgi:hypothetical protein
MNNATELSSEFISRFMFRNNLNAKKKENNFESSYVYSTYHFIF